MRLNRRHLAYAIIALLIIIPFLPIKYRYKFVTVARVYPEKEWKIIRNTDGSFTSELHTYSSNAVTDITNFRFERGDVATINLLNDFSKTGVKKGDSLAYIYSHFIENEIVKLQNLKEVDLAALEVATTGEKPSLIEGSLQKYNLAKEQYDLELKNLTRQQKLFLDTVITPSEFELHQNRFNLSKINLEIISNELLAMKTGQKPSEINLILERIKSYDKEIERYKMQVKTFHLISPVNGMLIYNDKIEEVLKVIDTTSYILAFPVKLVNVQYMNKINSITFEGPRGEIAFDTKRLIIEENVDLYSRSQAVLAKAVLVKKATGIKPGMLIKCVIYCDKVPLYELIMRGINLN